MFGRSRERVADLERQLAVAWGVVDELRQALDTAPSAEDIECVWKVADLRAAALAKATVRIAELAAENGQLCAGLPEVDLAIRVLQERGANGGAR